MSWLAGHAAFAQETRADREGRETAEHEAGILLRHAARLCDLCVERTGVDRARVDAESAQNAAQPALRGTIFHGNHVRRRIRVELTGGIDVVNHGSPPFTVMWIASEVPLH